MLTAAKIETTGRRRRRLPVSLLALLSACAAACGPSLPQEPGGLVGAIRFRGGPSEAVIRQRQGGHVRLVRAHEVFASAVERPGHRFHLSAPAGTYQLEATSGDAICRSKAVTIRAGATAQMDMICDVR